MARTVLLARALSVAALALCVAALASILLDGVARAPAAGDATITGVERLEASSARLARLTSGLGDATSARSVRRAIRATIAANASVSAELKRATAAAMPVDPRLPNALQADYEYLDALGSVLVNPRSPLRHQLAERARRARAAFGALRRHGSLPQTVAGWRRVAAYAAARRARLP